MGLFNREEKKQEKIKQDINIARNILINSGINPDTLDNETGNFLIWLQQLQNHSSQFDTGLDDLKSEFLNEIKNRTEINNKAQLFQIKQNTEILQELKKQNHNLEQLNSLLFDLKDYIEENCEGNGKETIDEEER